jgi:hypothetical protein
MKTPEEMARRIRYRQRELSALAPDRRHALLAAEIRHVCDGIAEPERRVLLDQLDSFFPVGLTEQAEIVPTVAETPPKPGLEDLLSALNAEVAARPDNEQRALRVQIAKRLGLETPHPATPPAAAGALSGALQVFKEAMLLSPDPVMNDPVEAFSARDIADLPGLAIKLRRQADPVSRFLWGKLAGPAQELVSNLVINQRRTSSDLDRGGETLAQEIKDLVEQGSLYDEQRFAGVTLSEESRRLLGKNLSGRALVRFNQSLLEDTYPTEIRCQTAEREFAESTIASLRGRGERPVSAEGALHLAAVSLIELGCLEQFARLVFKNLNKRVFDEVNGRLMLDERNEMGTFLSRFLAEGDSGRLAGNVRYFTGLLKCLLEWYAYIPEMSANALWELEPNELERRATKDGSFKSSVDYEKAFNNFRETYKRARQKLCGMIDNEGDLDQEKLKELINRTIERKVTTRVRNQYEWKGR